jgi:hypothetical protein
MQLSTQQRSRLRLAGLNLSGCLMAIACIAFLPITGAWWILTGGGPFGALRELGRRLHKLETETKS